MKIETDQITCIYASNSDLGQKLKAYLSASDKQTLLIDICKTMPSDTQWHDMSKRLNMSLGEFIDMDKLNSSHKNTDFSEESWVKILAKNPHAVRGALILADEKVTYITNYTDLLKFYGVDSAGLTKKKQGETPITQSQTKNNRFI